jgi:hypothetical protein
VVAFEQAHEVRRRQVGRTPEDNRRQPDVKRELEQSDDEQEDDQGTNRSPNRKGREAHHLILGRENRSNTLPE